MPYARKTTKPRKAYRKKRMVRRRRARAPKQAQTCFIKETIQLEDLKAGQAYESIFDLSLFSRATDLADNFQEYRMREVEFKYTPQYDTFSDISGAVSLPYLYSKRHTYPAPTTFNLAYLQALGSKPRRIDDKTLVVKYVPNISLLTNTATYTQTTPPSVLSGVKPNYKPWLNTHQTNPLTPTAPPFMDKTPHFGHAFWIDQTQTSPANTIVCRFEMTVHFEFRKPWDVASTQGAGMKQTITKKPSAN